MLQRADINDYLDLVEKPIRRISEASKAPDLFEKVCLACDSGRAFLFVDHNVFTVLMPVAAESCSRLLVWVAYGSGGSVISNYLPEVAALARQINLDELECQTTYPSMVRYLRRFGWTPAGKNRHFTILRLKL